MNAVCSLSNIAGVNMVFIEVAIISAQQLLTGQCCFVVESGSSQYFLPEERTHSAFVKADNTAASAKVLQALSSVAYGGVSSGAVEHHEFGSALGCTEACMEDLLKARRPS